jgi:hypothetical protein
MRPLHKLKPTLPKCLTWTLVGCQSAVLPPALPVMPGPEQAALPQVKSRVIGLTIHSATDMNESMALMLDVVFLYDDTLLSKLPKQAPAWFVARNDLALEYAGFLDVLSLEMTVSDAVSVRSLTARQKGAASVVLFANYLAQKGQQRVNLSVYQCPALSLMKQGVVIAEGKARGHWTVDDSDGEIHYDTQCDN